MAEKIGYFRFWLAVLNRARKEAWEHYGNLLVLATLAQLVLGANYFSKMLKGIDVDFLINFSPVIIVAIAFPILCTISAVKIANKQCKLEDFEAIVPQQTTKKLDIFIIILTILFVLMGVIIAEQNSKNKELTLALNAAKQNGEQKLPEIPKPLPDKIAPNLIPPPSTMAIETNQSAPSEVTQRQIETFGASTSDITDFALYMKQFEAGVAAQTEAKERKDDQGTLDAWNLYRPYYIHALTVFRDTLKSIGDKTGDGITQSANYSDCLPILPIAATNGEVTLAFIGLQKNTNMDFNIMLGGLETGFHRELIISSGGCYVELEPEWGQTFHRILHTDTEPPVDDTTNVPINQADELMLKGSKEIIGAREYILSQQNK
jgi:hypothetical protein